MRSGLFFRQFNPLKIKTMLVALLGLGVEGDKYWRPFLESRGDTVFGSDEPEDNQAVVDRAHVIIVAVPMHCVSDLIKSIHFRPDQLVIFVVGEWGTAADLTADLPCGVVFVHRMCGPVKSMLGQNMIVHVMCHGAHSDWLQAMVEDTEATLVDSDPTDHDRHTSVTQGLLRLSMICFFAAILQLRVKFDRLRHFSSPPFRLLLLVMCRILSQGATLCFDMLSCNKFARDAIGAMQEALSTVSHLIEKGDRTGFAKLFDSFHRHVGGNRIDRAARSFQQVIGGRVDQWDD